uniref:Parkinson disease protein 7 homolog n=1 Tax=Styela clava TaxID=7725 RepID=UPI001939F52D|nr:Parkinson disease protein 7 homolog [Styela clava]
MSSSLKRALVLLANGAEEMEAVISIDVMRRAEIEVTVAGVDASDKIMCSRGVCIIPDVDLQTAIEAAPYDAVVMPGGLKGATTLAESDGVKKLLEMQIQHTNLIGAICAAPIALKSHNIKPGSNITSHPSLKDKLEGYIYSEARVVKDNKLITSRGPGTSFEFALELVEMLKGKEVRDKISGPMVLA